MTALLFAAVLFIPQEPGTPSGARTGGPASQGEIRITVLFDNLTDDPRLTVGWGFSALLEASGHTLLFDTGADGDVLLENMRLLGKDPMAIDAVVISHAHSDHTGGLGALLDSGLRPTVYLLSAFPDQLAEGLASRARVVEAQPGQEILPGIFTTGTVGSAIPEQALVLKSSEGLVIITGCAHPGAVEMAARAGELFEEPLRAVMGGFHLTQASVEEIQNVIRSLKAMGIREAGPTHCSGETAMRLFSEAFGEGYVRLGVGRVLTLEAAETG